MCRNRFEAPESCQCGKADALALKGKRAEDWIVVVSLQFRMRNLQALSSRAPYKENHHTLDIPMKEEKRKVSTTKTCKNHKER